MTDGYKNFQIAMLDNFAQLNPKGLIASEQKELMVTALILMLIVVIPVLIMAFVFAWKYRAGNNSKYTPNFDRSRPIQFTWLAIISLLIFALGGIAWNSSHALDPRQTIKSNVEPITIQVVALQWKWLFIYPEQNIATVNLVQFPEDTPLNFEITADAPMNSFWIPQLGGQMYAMNGMKTKLHLEASEVGDYRGLSANISGEGFAGMTFIARASSRSDFDAWVETAKFYGNDLDYEELAKPSKNNEVAYLRPQADLFNSIVMKFMAKDHQHVR